VMFTQGFPMEFNRRHSSMHEFRAAIRNRKPRQNPAPLTGSDRENS
jgi:hypothetical protein